MPIILTPVVDEGSAGVSDSLTILSAEDSTKDGCPVLTRTRTIVANKGQAGTLQWELRNRAGQPVDISDLVDDCNSDTSLIACHHIKVRFAEAVAGSTTIVETDAVVVDAAAGIVQAVLPSAISEQSGIYQMSWGVLDPDGNPVLVDNGLLTVENGLWGSLEQDTGPPTLNEIRLRMRDTATDNQLLDEVEFSDAEIINALNQPLREFNEAAPPLGYTFGARNFPYKYNWVEATVAQLMMTSADWYRRNKMQTSHGGIQLNDRDKDNPYLQTAMLMKQAWQRFIITKKAQLNCEQATGSILSPYSNIHW